MFFAGMAADNTPVCNGAVVKGSLQLVSLVIVRCADIGGKG
jgi:hypothetical protein